MAELGVNGFGYFCQNKSGSAAGTKPDIEKMPDDQENIAGQVEKDMPTAR